MKKFALFCGLLLSLGLMSCDDMLPNPPGQSNPQPEIFTAADLTLSQAAYGTTNALNLNSYVERGELVPVLDITKLDKFPETYDLKLIMEVGSDADFTKVAQVSTTIEENVVYVTAGNLTNAIREVITKSPAELEVPARFKAEAVNGQSTMVLGGVDHYYYTGTYKVLPYQTYVVEEAYYLVGNFCGWDVKKGLKFERTVTTGNVYDAPTFAVKFDVTAEQAAEGFEYKVVPQSAVTAGNWNGAFGFEPNLNAEGQPEMNGNLISSPEAKTQAGVISQEGPYLVSVDIEAATYEVSFAIEYLYTPGNGSSQFDFNKVQRLSTNNFINYSGAAHLNRQWWLTAEASNNGLCYGLADGDEPVTDGFVTKGNIVAGSYNDLTKMPIPTNGLYWVNVNLVGLNYTATLLERVSLVGAFNGWDAESAKDLTHSKDFLTWTGTFDLDGEFKINTNGDWTIDFGSKTANIGSENALDYKGGNINVPAGKYDVTVSFATLPYTIKLVKK